MAASTLYEGIKTFDIRIRLPEEFRKTPEDIGELTGPHPKRLKSAIKEIATITKKTGSCLIFRDDNERYSALSSQFAEGIWVATIAEAQEKVNKAVNHKKRLQHGMAGRFRKPAKGPRSRLAKVVPISLLLIFILLFSMFGNFRDAGLVFLNVPFAIVGGIWRFSLPVPISVFLQALDLLPFRIAYRTE